jgi:hypothetical protein
MNLSVREDVGQVTFQDDVRRNCWKGNPAHYYGLSSIVAYASMMLPDPAHSRPLSGSGPLPSTDLCFQHLPSVIGS